MLPMDDGTPSDAKTIGELDTTAEWNELLVCEFHETA